MVIAPAEFLALAPLSLLAVVYWMRDKYLYNRVGSAWYSTTAVQRSTLFFVYPVWVFLEWSTGLQANRGEVALALFSTTGKFVIGHYTVIAVLNDSFLMTLPQFLSMGLGLVLAYVWTLYYAILVSGRDAGHVGGVEGNRTRCE